MILDTLSINLREREREIDWGAGAAVPGKADSGLAWGWDRRPPKPVPSTYVIINIL